MHKTISKIIAPRIYSIISITKASDKLNYRFRTCWLKNKCLIRKNNTTQKNNQINVKQKTLLESIEKVIVQHFYLVNHL